MDELFQEVQKHFEVIAYKATYWLIASTIGVVPLWNIMDFVKAPDYFFKYLPFRIAVEIGLVVILIVVYKKIVSWRIGLVLGTLLLTIWVAYLIVDAPKTILPMGFIGFSLIFAAVALFSYLDLKSFIFIVVITLVAFILTHLFHGRYSIVYLLTEGGTLLGSTILLSGGFLAFKNKWLINYLKSNLLLQDAYKELERSHQKLNRLKETLEEKNKVLTESLKYARHLQKSFIQNYTSDFPRFTRNYFVLHIPQSIISGDFYYITRQGDFYYLIVADATGHGIPGAMVSIFCLEALRYAMAQKETPTPAEILNGAQQYFLEASKGNNTFIEQGMAVTIIRCCPQKYEILYATAAQHFFLYRKNNNSFLLLRGDPVPIGVLTKSQSYQDRRVKLYKGDILYVYTDGYIDQLNPSGKRLGIKRFKKILEYVIQFPVSEQRNKFLNALYRWKGKQRQIDDITLIGFQVSDTETG